MARAEQLPPDMCSVSVSVSRHDLIVITRLTAHTEGGVRPITASLWTAVSDDRRNLDKLSCSLGDFTCTADFMPGAGIVGLRGLGDVGCLVSGAPSPVN